MKNKLITFAAALMLLAVASPLMGQARPTLIQDTDQAARQPFQTVVNLSTINNVAYVSVPIPSGKRLVIEYVSASGAVGAAASGPVQSIIVLGSSVAGSPHVDYYLTPTQSPLVAGQVAVAQTMSIYSDTLSVSYGFSGYTPNYMVFSVCISGHLVNIT